MKNKFESAFFISRTKDLRENADRIYFGNEFCQNLIPTSDFLKKWYFFAKARDKEFTFVTPFVTNASLEKLAILLDFLNRQDNPEVVFNDWGVFKFIKDNFKNIRPVLGRLLSKQFRDPRMFEILSGKQKAKEILSADKKTKTILLPQKIPPTLFEHYRSCAVNVAIFQDYLLSEGINRVEIDNLIWKMNVKVNPVRESFSNGVNKKIGVSIYLPYGYITTTRMCGKLTSTHTACAGECKKYFLRLEDKSLPVYIYGIGNTVFYETHMPSYEYLQSLGVDRIVFQPRLPF